MANETIVKFGAAKTLASAGGTISNNALAQAPTASYDVVADGGGYPDADFALVCTFATAPTEGAVLSLYARPLDIDGTADTDIPETTRPTLWVGNFAVNNVTTSQALWLRAYDLPKLADYYVHNNGTGQTVSSGWTLKVTPRTVGPA